MNEQPVISGEAQKRDDEEEQGIGGDASPSHRRQGMTPQNYSFFIWFKLIFLCFFYWELSVHPRRASDKAVTHPK
jgi:hypothetical protein